MVIEKKKPFDGVKRVFTKIGKRNLIIALAVLLVGGAILVNWAVFANKDDVYDGYDVSSGMSNSYGDTTDAGKTEDFFAATQISRERARDEALEVLQSVVDDEAADEASKTAAYESITKMAKQMDNEANIESLVVAKGFAQCVAVLNDESASIVVKSDSELSAAQLSQINEIVYTQAGISPENITVIRK